MHRAAVAVPYIHLLKYRIDTRKKMSELSINLTSYLCLFQIDHPPHSSKALEIVMSSQRSVKSNKTAMSDSTTATSSGSASPVDSRDTEERETDALFDEIEDLIADFMRQPHRHHAYHRHLRCFVDERETRWCQIQVTIQPRRRRRRRRRRTTWTMNDRTTNVVFLLLHVSIEISFREENKFT